MDVVFTKYKMYPFLGIKIHWIEPREEREHLKELGLALMSLKVPHSGKNLFESFTEVVQTEFGILNKVLLPH